MGEYKELPISCGKTTDSFEELKNYCEHNAAGLSLMGEDIMNYHVLFWTEDYPELIGICKFSKGSSGYITYDIDYSLSTL